jgi:hypothetical protein
LATSSPITGGTVFIDGLDVKLPNLLVLGSIAITKEETIAIQSRYEQLGTLISDPHHV